METQNIKLIVAIQCSITKKRCSGYHCMQAFYERSGGFQRYPLEQNLRLLTFECGGCCGKGISSLLSNVEKCRKKEDKISKEEIAIHFSSCITLNNHHSDRCIFLPSMKEIAKKLGYQNIFEDTWHSKTASRRRAEGIYKS